MAKFQEQIPRKPDLNNIKKCYHSYIEFCDSMVFGIDPRSRLLEARPNNIKIIIVTYFMLQIKKYCYHSYIEFCDSMVFFG